MPKRKSNIVTFVPRPRCAAEEAAADDAFAAEAKAIEFEAVPEFVNFSTIGARAEAHEDKLKRFSIATRWTIAILGQSKPKLVEFVKDIDADNPQIADDLLRDLMAAREFLQGIDSMINAASHRLGVAIACNTQAAE